VSSALGSKFDRLVYRPSSMGMLRQRGSKADLCTAVVFIT